MGIQRTTPFTGRPRSVDPTGVESATYRLVVLLTPTQQASVQASAKELGMSVGEYVRDRLGF
jgi:hypothetical protein